MELKKVSLKLLFLLGLMSCITTTSYAQLGDVGKILQSSKEDANVLVKEYLNPVGSGFGAGLNTGWTNTAKPHKKLGFDLTVSTALAIVPGSDKTFNATQIGLQELEVKSGPNTLQTISGSNNAPTTTLAAYSNTDYNNDGQRDELFEFDMPDGTGFGYAPAPQIKASVGLFMDTDLMLRYVPKVKIGDYGTFQQFGVGAQHSINQWLPGGNLLPVDLSIMAGYTNQKVSSDFRLTGKDIIVNPNETENPYADKPETWDGQNIQVKTNAFTINALVGKTLPVISVYGGVGYEASSMSVSTPGTYPTIGQNNDPNSSKPLTVKTTQEPIDVKIDGKNGFHALVGFRFRFAIFHISGSYTLANYSSYNVGFGISFR